MRKKDHCNDVAEKSLKLLSTYSQILLGKDYNENILKI